MTGGIRWRVKPPEQLVWREVADEVVILDLRTSVYWSLNGSAALLWPALVEGASSEELVGRLVQEYGINEDVASDDVRNFLASCQTQDLVERS